MRARHANASLTDNHRRARMVTRAPSAAALAHRKARLLPPAELDARLLQAPSTFTLSRRLRSRTAARQRAELHVGEPPRFTSSPRWCSRAVTTLNTRLLGVTRRVLLMIPAKPSVALELLRHLHAELRALEHLAEPAFIACPSVALLMSPRLNRGCRKLPDVYRCSSTTPLSQDDDAWPPYPLMRLTDDSSPFLLGQGRRH